MVKPQDAVVAVRSRVADKRNMVPTVTLYDEVVRSRRLEAHKCQSLLSRIVEVVVGHHVVNGQACEPDAVDVAGHLDEVA